MEKHYHHFENVEENKFIYTDIFKEYVSAPLPLPLQLGISDCSSLSLQTELIEKHLESELKLRVPGFVMEQFMKSLE